MKPPTPKLTKSPLKKSPHTGETCGGVFNSFGPLLPFVQNEKSMQTLSFALFEILVSN